MSIIENMKKGVKLIFSKRPIYTTANITLQSPNNRLKSKKIIITGGGRGLGYFMAKRFIEEGADVLISGRNEQSLKKAADEIGCKFHPLDITNISSFDSFVSEASTLLGGLNCLVNNAGVSLHENGILNVSPDQFDTQINTNLKGAYFLSKSFIAKCNQNIDNETKNILFISSETGITVDERPYGLTKAALNSLVQGLAYRFVSQGYRINAIAPGITATDMTGRNAKGNLYNAGSPSKRIYIPEEMAEIACFLLSDVSNLLNGQILVCNEGHTINARWK